MSEITAENVSNLQVFATNSAGITGEAQSQNFKINLPGSGLGGLKTGVVVAICIVVVVIALALITLIFFRWRYILPVLPHH